MDLNTVGTYEVKKDFRYVVNGEFFTKGNGPFIITQSSFMPGSEEASYKLFYTRNIIKVGPVASILIASELELLINFKKISNETV